MSTNRPTPAEDLDYILRRVALAINRETLQLVGEEHIRAFSLARMEDPVAEDRLLATGDRYVRGAASRDDVVKACEELLAAWRLAAQTFMARVETRPAPRPSPLVR